VETWLFKLSKIFSCSFDDKKSKCSSQQPKERQAQASKDSILKLQMTIESLDMIVNVINLAIRFEGVENGYNCSFLCSGSLAVLFPSFCLAAASFIVAFF
jgi:hypothetical protein